MIQRFGTNHFSEHSLSPCFSTKRIRRSLFVKNLVFGPLNKVVCSRQLHWRTAVLTILLIDTLACVGKVFPILPPFAVHLLDRSSFEFLIQGRSCNSYQPGDLAFARSCSQQYFYLRTLFQRQVLEFLFCAMLLLSHGEPPGALLCGASILPRSPRLFFFSLLVRVHFTINPS